MKYIYMLYTNYRSKYKYLKFISLCVSLIGLLSFGTALFNKFSFHDEAGFFDNSIGGDYVLGRWMLPVFVKAMNVLFGSCISLPVINICLTFLLLILIVCLIQNLFKIENKSLLFLVCFMFASSPCLSALFGYLFMAQYYTLAFLMSTFSCYLVCKFNKWYTFIVAVLLQTLSLGIYQATIPYVLSLMLIYYIVKIYDSEPSPEKTKKLLLEIVKYILFCILFVILYIITTKIINTIKGVQLSNYQGIGKIGESSPFELLQRIPEAYAGFLTGELYFDKGFFPLCLRPFYYIVLLLLLFLSIILIYRTFKKSIFHGVLITVCLLLMPIALNFIVIMASGSFFHSLMLFGFIHLFVGIIAFFNIIKFEFFKTKKVLSIIICILFIYFGVNNIYFDNKCFLKADMIQNRLFVNYSTLITRIKSVDGYKDEMPIAFVDIEKFEDKTFKDTDLVIINNYIYGSPTSDFFLESYNYQKQISILTGFSPVYKDGNQFSDQTKNMPHYPDDGSIKVIGNTVVVKF